jgi:cellulose biosynthesis protein BcsQ
MVHLLLADSVPTWTDKELLTAVGSVLAAVTSIAWTLVKVLNSVSERKAAKAEDRARILEMELNKANEFISSGNPELTKNLELAHQKIHELQLANAQGQEKYKVLYDGARQMQSKVGQRLTAEAAKLSALMKNLEIAEHAAAQHKGELLFEQKRIQHALKGEGYTWHEKVLASVPEFKPLESTGRRTPIISVLNLKGGVGKTTIAANLGAALDQLGHHLLLVDLDLQGSLTSLFLSDRQTDVAVKSHKVIADFLAASFDAESPNILDFIQHILAEGKSAVVPTTDQLVYEESRLTIRWMLREAARDPRFLLRKELHMKRVSSRFDMVLLDCPPMINVCCVNALAASDYLLIPILPSEQATARVPVLIERFKEFRENINPDLKILGIVINRTHGSELTTDEAARLVRLEGVCRDRLGEQVSQFETFIRQTPDVRRAEDEHRTLQATDNSYATFTELALEVESRLPSFARQRYAERTPMEVNT